MRRSLVAIVPVSLSLFVAACGERTATSPSAITPGQSLASRPGPTCSFSTVNQDASAFFKSGDSAFIYVKAMKDAGAGAPATPAGFNLLSRVAAVRYTSGQKTGSTIADAATLVNDALLCMDVGTIPGTFNAPAALTSGIFEVVSGGSNTPTEAMAYVGTAAGLKVLASPKWGVEPRNVSWPSSTGAGAPRFLIYGYPVTAGDSLYANETPAGLNAFEVGTLRADVSKSDMRVGICSRLVVVSNSKAVAANVLIHNSQIVPNESPGFCDRLAFAGTTKTWLASMSDRVTSLFTPKLAYAETDDGFSRAFIGGGPSGWSPMVFGAVTGSSMSLQFTTQPKNTRVGFDIPAFVVTAISAEGNPLPGVLVTVSIAGNSGVPADAIITGGDTTVTTGPDGTATFSGIKLGKTGGYTLVANGSYGATEDAPLSGVPTNTAISTLFNVKK